jgi:exopolysaccharide biosynthesis polyprenyl glycosylphosphotransferase
MTEILGHSADPSSLAEALVEQARDAAYAGGEEQRPRHSHRLGVWLRAGTIATDVTAAACALLWLDITGGISLGFAVPPLALGWLVLLRAWGAYRRGIGYSLSAEIKTMVLGAFSGSLILLQLGPLAGLHVRAGTGVAIGIPIALLSFGRLLLRVASGALRKRRALVRRVLLVGDGPDAYELLENLEAWPGHGVEVVGVCADTTSPSVRGLPVLGLSRSCNLVARDLGLRTVILAPAALDSHACSKIHSELLGAEMEVVLAPNVTDVEATRLSTRQLGGLPVLRLVQREHRLRRTCKRAFDLALSALLTVLLAPFLALVAAIVRLDSPGPAFFRQRRIGKDGKPFELWKFRTMRIDAETLLEELRRSKADGDGNGVLFKLRDDPRVTRIGRWLRRTSLDELPQLWNVLVGEMSLVGPRPALPHEVAEFDDFTLRRLRVKPGITGLWQVSGRSDASFATYSRMDAFYAENWTLLGDLRILSRTLPVVFGSKGAY